VPPVSRHEVDIQPQFPGHLPPQRRKLSRLEHQHPIAGGESIDERRFPGSGSGGWIDHNAPGRLEYFLEPFQNLEPQPGEFLASVVDRRLGHRAQNAARQPRAGQAPSAGRDGAPATRTRQPEASAWIGRRMSFPFGVISTQPSVRVGFASDSSRTGPVNSFFRPFECRKIACGRARIRRPFPQFTNNSNPWHLVLFHSLESQKH